MALTYGGNGTIIWRKWHYLMEEMALSYGGNGTILRRKWHYHTEEMALSYGGNGTIYLGRRNILTFISNVVEVKKKIMFCPFTL